MKNFIKISILTILMYSCNDTNVDVSKANRIDLEEDLKDIVVSYIQYQTCEDCIYEVYINKINPHYVQVLLYKGDKSLTIKEREINNRLPIFYTEIESKKISVFTGAEDYFKTPMLKLEDLKKDENKKSFNVWMVTDSLNIRKIDTLEYAYPFLPLPSRREFPTPY